MKKTSKKEDIFNVPNALTLSRIFITFFVIYTILAKWNVIITASAFVIGMLTDFFDGYIARKYKKVTELGRKFDMTADRFLMIGTAIAFLVSYNGIMNLNHWVQVGLIMSREILTLPFVLYTNIKKGLNTEIPHAKFIGKLTTFMQGVAFPLVIFGIFYQQFRFSVYFAAATGIIGILSGIQHIKTSE